MIITNIWGFFVVEKKWHYHFALSNAACDHFFLLILMGFFWYFSILHKILGWILWLFIGKYFERSDISSGCFTSHCQAHVGLKVPRNKTIPASNAAILFKFFAFLCTSSRLLNWAEDFEFAVYHRKFTLEIRCNDNENN